MSHADLASATPRPMLADAHGHVAVHEQQLQQRRIRRRPDRRPDRDRRSRRTPFGARATRAARPSAASTPVSPTAGTPCATSAATSSVFADPARTETTDVERGAIGHAQAVDFSRRNRAPLELDVDRIGRRHGRRPAAARPRLRRRTPPSRSAARPFRAARRRASAPGARSQQCRPFVEAVSDVEVLQRLTCGALDQVVEARDENEATGAGVEPPAESQKFVHTTCLISGSASCVSRTKGSFA